MSKAHSDRLVVLTGAGVSAESGIPTFRGAGGLWEGHHPEDLATPSAFRADPDRVWRFYEWRRSIVADHAPNAAHRLLASIEACVPNFDLITQNVDGYHQEAGCPSVIELHGSLWSLRCTQCAHRWKDRRVPLLPPLPTCPMCGSLARPDVVWFGESLPADAIQRATTAASQAGTMLVIGTSSLVYPAAGLPHLARRAGACVVEINPEATPLSPECDRVYRGAATEQLVKWWGEAQSRWLTT